MERVLITGASRGIGRAIANQLATPERHLFINGRDHEALVEVFTELEQKGCSCTILRHDLSSPQEIERLTDKLGTEPLHLLVNNAGIAVPQSLQEMTLDDWHEMFAINVTAPFLLTQKLVPRMPRGGSIVNILSTAARNGFPGFAGYCMSKFALDGFSRSIREELRESEIRVINIYPAATDTEIWDDFPGEWPRDKMIPPQEVAEAVAYAISRPFNVQVEDVTLGRIEGNL